MFRAVVFDFDGTIVDSIGVKGECFSAVFARFGAPCAEYAARFHSENPGVNRVPKIRQIASDLGLAFSDDDVDQVAREFGKLAEDRVVTCDPIPGAIEVLERLFDLIPLFLSSATPQDELEVIVKRRDLRRFFRRVDGYPTPKTEAIIRAGHDVSCDVSEVLMVGDSVADQRAAEVVGSSFHRVEGGFRDFPSWALFTRNS